MSKAEESKKRPAKDTTGPKGPKRAKSAYQYWSSIERPKLKNEQPNLTNAEVTAQIKAIWNNLDTDSKAPFETKAAVVSRTPRKD